MMNSYRKGARGAALGVAAATVLSLAAPALAAGANANAGANVTPVTAKAPAPAPQPAAASPAFPQFQQFADGTMIMTLGNSFLNITLGQRQPDGSIRQFCVDNAAAANTLLTAAPASEDK